MRNVSRLDSFYEDMKVLHSKLPDWRFMQLMLNFFSWHYERYRTDGFYLEESDFLDRFREFVEEETSF
jgi:hypothetical protein